MFSCRFYSNRLPEVDDVVMVNVRSIAEIGIYVTLLEYNNIEGLILLSELSRRRIRSINKLIRVGTNECVVVIKVDTDKGYIDLSKRRVSPGEVTECEERFAKAKAVDGILRHVGVLLDYKRDKQLDDLYIKTAWHINEKFKRPTASYDVFKHAVTNPELLAGCDVDERTKEVLLENIKRRLSPQSVKIRAEIEVLCTNYEGVDAIKRALRKGLEFSTEPVPIKINLIAPPQYVVTTQTLVRTDGLNTLNAALQAIKASIEEAGGMFNIQVQPKMVSNIDEQEFAIKLQQLENEEIEISEDDSEEDGDSDGDDDCDDYCY